MKTLSLPKKKKKVFHVKKSDNKGKDASVENKSSVN